MVDRFVVGSGIGQVKSFSEKPRFIADAAISAIIRGEEITEHVRQVILQGYSAAVRRFIRYSEKNLARAIPYGSHGITGASTKAAEQALRDFITESGRLTTYADNIAKILPVMESEMPTTDPRYIEMLQKVAYFREAQADPLKVTLVNFFSTTIVPSFQFSIEQLQRYDTPIDSLDGYSYLTNYVGSSQNKKVVTARLSTYPSKDYQPGFWTHMGVYIGLEGKEETVLKTYYVALGGGPYYHNEVGRYWYTAVYVSYMEFKVEGYGDRIFNTWILSERIDDHVEAPRSNTTTGYPIIQMIKNQTSIDNPDIGTQIQYKETKKALNIIDVPLDDYIDALTDTSSNDELEHIDDAFSLFAANLTSPDKYNIRYCMDFFGTLREGVPYGEYDIRKDYVPLEGSLLESQDAQVRLIMSTGYNARAYYDSLLKYDYITVTINGEYKYAMFTYYIFTEVVEEVIGPVGKTGIFVFENYPAVTNGDEQYIEYKYQITKTHLKRTIVFFPLVQYYDYYNTGDTEGNRIASVSLVGEVQDGLTVPLNNLIMGGYNRLKESYIFVDNLSVFIFAIKIEETPKWKIALKVILIIVIFILVAWLAPVLLPALIITITISNIVTHIVTDAINDAAGAVAGVVVGVVLAIISLGSNIGALVDSIIQLTLGLLGLAVQLVQLTFSIQALALANDLNGLLEQIEESEEQIKKAEDLVGLDTHSINPLNVLNNMLGAEITPQMMLDRNLLISTSVMVDMTQNFTTRAIALPILKFDPESRKGYIPVNT